MFRSGRTSVQISSAATLAARVRVAVTAPLAMNLPQRVDAGITLASIVDSQASPVSGVPTARFVHCKMRRLSTIRLTMLRWRSLRNPHRSRPDVDC